VGAQGGSYDREQRSLSPERLAPRLVPITDPTSVASKGYHTLRTNLIYCLVDTPPKVIVLTDPGLEKGRASPTRSPYRSIRGA
jgi:hypothetical protein